MSDEVRNISVVLQASAAERGLIRLANQLDQLNGATGKSDAGLRKVDRTIDKAAAGMIQAARNVANLKGQLKEMSKDLTAADNSNNKLTKSLTRVTKELGEAKAIMKLQQSVITGLAKELTKAASGYDMVAAAAARAANQTMKVKANTDTKAGSSRVADNLSYIPANTKSPALGASFGAIDGDLGAANAKMQAATGLSNALRYQLYDVAATFGIVGAAALGASVLVLKTTIDWEKNFANVVRTSQVTGSAIDWLKNEFLDLQSAIPVTSADLAIIGTLGAQMGVAAANLANFTEITAKFSATSGTSVDEAATALSRLDQLLPDVQGNYERLASTILKTGVNAVATEQQIIRGTGQIAAIGRIAGLTTPEIVGLASALSSLGFSPELQRSVITSSFSKILTATSQVTAQTEKFGAVLNMTGKEFQTAWREDAIGTYRNLLQAIASRGDAVSVLQDLGLASQRLTPNLLKLGQNTEVLNAALADTGGEWRTTGELTRQYSVIADTVAARIQVLGQAWEALLVTLDSSDTVVKPLLDVLTNILRWARDMAKNPAAGTIATIGTAIVGLAGITALATAGLAAMAGGYLALNFAQRNITAALAEHVALTAADTVATNANTAAKAANSGANLANTAATNANTVAQGANAATMGRMEAGLLGTTNKFISAVPKVLAWTGVIAAATAAAVGLYTVLTTADSWTVDLDKMLNGVDNSDTGAVIDYNVEQLKKLQNQLAEMRVEQDKYDKFIANGGNEWDINLPGDANGFDYGKLAWDNVEGQQDRFFKDIEEQILGLTSMEDKYAAVNDVAKTLGITQQELLTNILPGLGSALGSNGAAMAEAAEATELLEAAQALWAAQLLTTDENLAKLTDGLQTGAAKFLDFGSLLSDSYSEGGGGLQGFIDGMGSSLTSFESFYGDLGTLVRKGGIQLAALFAEAGPEAAQALTDSLALDGSQIAAIEENFRLAAFYASDAFKNTFAQNNAILADVWKQTNSTEAVAAFNAALADSMKGGSIDQAAAVLAQLSEQYGVKIDVGAILDIDSDLWDAQMALLDAQIKPLKIPVTTNVGQGDFTVTNEVDAWIVTMEGHTITLPVDPSTTEGAALIAEWRANEYQTPVSLTTWADTANADAQMRGLYNAWNNKSVVFKVATSYAYNSGSVGGIPGSASGSLVANNRLIRNSYPGYAKGTSMLKGAGTGTSDSMLIRVSNGEAITRARAVRYYGPKFMEDLNKMRLPRFASGGFPMGTPASPQSYGGTGVTVNVEQYYPTTRDPIKTMKHDAEAVLAGIWN